MRATRQSRSICGRAGSRKGLQSLIRFQYGKRPEHGLDSGVLAFLRFRRALLLGASHISNRLLCGVSESHAYRAGTRLIRLVLVFDEAAVHAASDIHRFKNAVMPDMAIIFFIASNHVHHRVGHGEHCRRGNTPTACLCPKFVHLHFQPFDIHHSGLLRNGNNFCRHVGDFPLPSSWGGAPLFQSKPHKFRHFRSPFHTIIRNKDIT